MKFIIFVILLVLISPLVHTKAQNFSDKEKQEILLNLTKYNSLQSFNAIMKVIDNKIIEAMPTILDHLWKQSPDMQYWYLIALKVLEYQGTQSLTLAFVDSLDDLKDPPNEIDQDELKYLANTILFSFNDFSRRTNTYKYFYKIFPENDYSMIPQLAKILEQFSLSETSAKEALIKIAENSENGPDRWVAISYLYDIYRENILELAIHRLLEEKDCTTKISILNEIVGNIRGAKEHELFLNQIQKDTCNYLLSNYAEYLFRDYATPRDYKLVKELIPRTKDLATKEHILFLANDFKPIIIDSTSFIKNNIDSLTSYHSQCDSFKWFGENNFTNQIYNLLINAKTELETADSISTAFSLKQYQSIIKKVYLDTLKSDSKFVTKDAYIFLYYYPKYILNRLPKVPWIESIIPEMTLRKSSGIQITISGSDFKSDATVLWNNLPQKIMSVTDTLIRVEIDKKESNKEGIYKITVKNPDGIISNEAAFKITNKLEFPIIPVLECVRKNEDNSYTAYFGYDNKNGISVLLQIGEENKFDPSEHDRLQPEIFMPGRHKNIFSVKFDGRKIMWKLNKEKITADKNSPECK